MDHVAEKYGKLHLRKIIHTITSIRGRGTAWGRPPLCVSLGGGFDTLEEPNAHSNQTGRKHDSQQRIGDHDSPNLSHQRSKRSNLRQQHSDAGSSSALGVSLLPQKIMVAGVGLEPALSRVRTWRVETSPPPCEISVNTSAQARSAAAASKCVTFFYFL